MKKRTIKEMKKNQLLRENEQKEIIRKETETYKLMYERMKKLSEKEND